MVLIHVLARQELYALYFFHLISPLICIMLPMKEVLWKSGLPAVNFVGKTVAPFIVNQDSF